jgi:hypothetical protein
VAGAGAQSYNSAGAGAEKTGVCTALGTPQVVGKWRILVTVNFCQLLLQKYLYLKINVIKYLEIWQWVKMIND